MPQQPAPALGRGAAGRLQHRHRRRHPDQRLLVAVAVEHDRLRVALPADARAGRSFPAWPGTRRSCRSGWRPLPHPRRRAGDRRTRRAGSGCSSARCRRSGCPPSRTARAASTLRAAPAFGVVQQPLGEHRSAAAGAALLDHDLEAGRFQQLHGGDADPRVVVLGEGVVEVDDLASGLALRAAGWRRVSCHQLEKVLNWKGDSVRSGWTPIAFIIGRPSGVRSTKLAIGATGRVSRESCGCGQRAWPGAACRGRRGNGPGTPS